jgi:hypothetical protein
VRGYALDTLVDTYARFAAMGAVLDVARFPILPGGSHEAAIQGMRVFAKRHEENGDFHIGINPDVDSGKRRIDGEQISFREFLGSGYDVDADMVCRPKRAWLIRRMFIRLPGGSRSPTGDGGLARALLDPPYGLQPPEAVGKFGSPGYARREKAWMREILRAFCAEVLAIDDLQRVSHLRIHRWTMDWSNYFQPGLEWWGAFFWTVEDTKNGWVTVIGASTTD